MIAVARAISLSAAIPVRAFGPIIRVVAGLVAFIDMSRAVRALLVERAASVADQCGLKNINVHLVYLRLW
jgi:hypothetical protein